MELEIIGRSKAPTRNLMDIMDILSYYTVSRIPCSSCFHLFIFLVALSSPNDKYAIRTSPVLLVPGRQCSVLSGNGVISLICLHEQY